MYNDDIEGDLHLVMFKIFTKKIRYENQTKVITDNCWRWRVKLLGRRKELISHRSLLQYQANELNTKNTC